MDSKWHNLFPDLRFYISGWVFIGYKRCLFGGHEIHVSSKEPARKQCLELMNKIGGVWWAPIKIDNIKAQNLASRCGMTVNCYKRDYVIYRGEYGRNH